MSSSGYKARYLDDPDEHYAKITALRDKSIGDGKVSWVDIGAMYGVSDRAVSRWYKRETKRKNEEVEESVIQELVRLKKEEKSNGNGNGNDASYRTSGKYSLIDNLDELELTDEQVEVIMNVLIEAQNQRANTITKPDDAIYSMGEVPLDKLATKILELEDTDDTVLYPERWSEYQLIDKLPRYYKMPPTGYISDLPMQEWLQKYLGHMKGGFKWEEEYLDELDYVLINGDWHLVLLPRGHGKTLRVYGHIIRYIAESRKSVLYIVASNTHAKKVLINLYKIVSHPVFRRTYGDIIKGMNKQDIIFEIHPDIDTEGSPDYLLQVASKSSDSVIGNHPSWLHLEDIVQEPFKSISANESVQNWMKDVLNPMMSLESDVESRVTATGTRKGTNDIYAFMMEDLQFNVLHRKALNECGIPNISDIEVKEYHDESGNKRHKVLGLKDESFFDKFKKGMLNKSMSPISMLEFIMRNGANVFSTQLQNNPVPSEGRTFDRKWWESSVIDDSRIPYDATMRYFQWTDPAYGVTKAADRFVSMVCAVFYGELYVVDGFALEGDDTRYDKAKKKVQELHNKWMPDKHWIDANFGQRFHKEDGVSSLPIKEYKTTRRDDKQLRIEALSVPFQQNIIWISDALPFLNIFHEEYLSFDYRMSKNNEIRDDCLDCLSGIVDKVRKYLKYGPDAGGGQRVGIPPRFGEDDHYLQ